MSISEELKQLEAMLEKGTLTQEEFQRAKQRVLSAAQPGPSALELEDLKIQSDLNRLDLEWIKEREQYMVRRRYGGAHRPEWNTGTFTSFVLIIAVGMFLTIAGVPRRNAPNPHASNPFLMFGPIIIGVGVVGGVIARVRAALYDDAEQSYLRRRSKLIDRQLGIDHQIRVPEEESLPEVSDEQDAEEQDPGLPTDR